MLAEVNQKVEQLSGMMERMSARFVLLETKLKTLHVTPPGNTPADREMETHPLTKREGDTEEKRENKKDSSQTSKRVAPAVSVVAKETTISMETSASRARTALADLSNPRPSPGTHHTPHTSTPHTRHTLTPVARRPGGRGRALSSQLARLRAEERLSPLPLSPPHPLTPSHPHTPSTPSHSLFSPMSTSPVSQSHSVVYTIHHYSSGRDYTYDSKPQRKV